MSTAAVTLATTIPGEHVRIAVSKDTEPFWIAAKERRLWRRSAATVRPSGCPRHRSAPTANLRR